MCPSGKIDFPYMKTASPRSQTAPGVPRPPGPPPPLFKIWRNAPRRIPRKIAQTASIGRGGDPPHQLHRWNGLGRARGGVTAHPPHLATGEAARARATGRAQYRLALAPPGQGLRPRGQWGGWAVRVGAPLRKTTRPRPHPWQAAAGEIFFYCGPQPSAEALLRPQWRVWAHGTWGGVRGAAAWPRTRARGHPATGEAPRARATGS